MAAGSLSAIGTEYGPCDGECQHRDCKATRRMAGSKCRLCGEAIGYESSFYRDDDGAPTEGGWPYALVHALCLLTEVES